MLPLAGKVCIVTGASRGIGKGIALQLSEKGAKVYITGRTLDPPKGSGVKGSLRETAQEIEARGGTCIPVQCDHSKDVEVERLFEQVKKENDGQLDILVNNAYSAVRALYESMGMAFWEQEPSMWDTINNVGLRNHYICAVYAARIMAPRNQGLIVNISSAAGLQYFINTAFGIGKEACDRMAADCGFELRKHNVAFVSLWPGVVGTETTFALLDETAKTGQVKDVVGLPSDRKKLQELFSTCETPEFAGQCIASLATDPDLLKMTGKVLPTYDLGMRYGLKDKEGHTPIDICSLKLGLAKLGHSWLAMMVPAFVRIPKWLMSMVGNKF